MAQTTDRWDGEERRQPALILLVGDDDAATELLSRVLRARGYRTVHASTIQEALAQAHEQLPRCVVVDLSAEDVSSSMQLLDGLRQSDEEPVRTTRVVVLDRSAANRLISFQSGADGFLERPFHASDLVELIEQVLAVPPEERAQHRQRMIEA